MGRKEKHRCSECWEPYCDCGRDNFGCDFCSACNDQKAEDDDLHAAEMEDSISAMIDEDCYGLEA